MKKFICSIIFLWCCVAAWAQSPNLMSYQAIIRNSANQLIVSSPLGVRVSLLQGSATGTVVFREIYNPNPVTNANGLLGLNIGSGVSNIGSFGQVNWSQGPYFVQVDVDPTGGTNYSISSVSQLLSVPYALHAKTAEVPGLPGPQGPIGLTGPAGPQGATGAVGPQGPIGLTGPAGPQGVPGNDGAVGPQGPIGLTGPAGPQGAQGVPGNDGAVGPQGPIGLTGPQGPQGVPGDDGAVGPQGPIGLTGPAGPQGVPGNDGAVGPQGPIGLTGPAGPQGVPGTDGAVGPQGLIGLTGPAGPQGVPGNDGAVGPQGPIGLTGPAGPQGPQGNFPSGTQSGEMNYWNGSSWVVVPPGNYGQLLSFCNGVPTWGGCLPIVTTTAASAITANGATTGGNVTSDGGLVVTARGVVYGTSPNPTIQGASTSNGTGTGAFTSQLTGLTASTNYYVRAYATNSVGTAYGNEATFFTEAFITIVFSVDMSQYVGSINNVHMAGNFSDLGASVNGNPIGNWHDFVPMVNTSGNIYSVSVQFPLTSQGLNFEWKFINGSGWNYPHEIFNSSYQCTALDPQGVYYNRQITTQTNISYLYCYNSCFVCTPSFALVTTTSASFITTSAATTGGNVTSDGGAAVMARGVAYGTSVNPTTSGTITNNGTGTGVFTSQLSGLTPSTAYFARAYAINSVGTAYGNEVTFTTLSTIPSFTCGTTTVTDVDGNSYATVQIGTQCWTQSNLTVSKYRDGSSIPNITDNTQWSQTNTSSTGAWCNYNNNASNGTTYGKMYNWYAVNDSRGLCPTGWHVPTDAEWTTLTTHLGGTLVAVGAMKSTTGWNSPNTGATNLSGFTGLPGGYRSNIGGFYNVGNYGYWWSSSGAGSGHAWYRDLYYNDASVYRGNGDRRGGFSVRCVRD